jgi:hypothetical protein
VSAKIGFHEKLFQKSAFFMKIGVFHKNWRFSQKSAFFTKISIFGKKYLKIDVLQKSVFLQKWAILRKSAILQKSAFL